MDKFKIKIREIVEVIGADPLIKFDIYKDDILIGEAEAEYPVFSGIMLGKWNSFMSNKMQNIVAATTTWNSR